jgi:hypothetical protein
MIFINALALSFVSTLVSAAAVQEPPVDVSAAAIQEPPVDFHEVTDFTESGLERRGSSDPMSGFKNCDSGTIAEVQSISFNPYQNSQTGYSSSKWDLAYQNTATFTLNTKRDYNFKNIVVKYSLGYYTFGNTLVKIPDVVSISTNVVCTVFLTYSFIYLCI